MPRQAIKPTHTATLKLNPKMLWKITPPAMAPMIAPSAAPPAALTETRGEMEAPKQ